MWKLVSKGFLLCATLRSCNWGIFDARCLFGCEHLEDEAHIFLHCTVARAFWLASPWRIRWEKLPGRQCRCSPQYFWLICLLSYQFTLKTVPFSFSSLFLSSIHYGSCEIVLFLKGNAQFLRRKSGLCSKGLVSTRSCFCPILHNGPTLPQEKWYLCRGVLPRLDSLRLIVVLLSRKALWGLE